MNIILLIVLILIGLSINESKKDNHMTEIYGITCAIILYIYFFVLWPQKIISKGDNDKVSYKNMMLWINMKKLDVLNESDKKWAKNILINDAPNKLGCYIDNKNVNNKEILRHIEIFNMMFQHLPKYIKFKYKVDNNIKSFCKKKNLKIINKNLFRRTI